MKANLKLERINGYYENIDPLLLVQNLIIKEQTGINNMQGLSAHRDWVAEITGRDAKYKYARTFLHGKVDYAQANSKATRGLYVNYILEEGHVYEVSAPQSWKRTERYFCTVSREGIIVEMTKEAVDEWLKSRLE